MNLLYEGMHNNNNNKKKKKKKKKKKTKKKKKKKDDHKDEIKSFSKLSPVFKLQDYYFSKGYKICLEYI